MSQYSYQNSHSNGDQWNTNVTDEWLDRLALDGYDIKQILASIFVRYKEDSVAFGKYMSRRAASLKSCKYKVKNFLPKLPINMQVNQIVSLLMDKYRISSDGAQLLLEDYLWLYQGQNQVLLQLSRRGMTVVKCQQGRSNSVIFFCNDQMRSNYQKFGDVVCVDFKPINIKNNPKNKNYMAGIFTGQDTNLHHILFGVALINQDKYQNYSNVIKSFFKAMKLRRYPQSFIVGNCQTLYRAICDISLTNQQQGRQSFGCLVGWHHLLQKLMKQYKSHKDKDQILQKFGNVLSSLNKQQMVSKIKQLLKLLPNDQHLLKFIAEHSKYFVANNQPCFIGFGIEKDHFSFLYKAMESFFKNVESIGFFFQQAVKLQEMLLSRIKKTGYELITLKQFDTLGVKLTDQIKYLSIRLQKKLFKKFLMMYQTAVKHAKIIARSLDGLYYQVTFNTDRQLPYKAYVYTLYYNLEDNCWRCNCGFIQQSGIPCAHLIKLIRKFRGSLAYYINRRWMIQNSKFNPQQAYNNEQKGMQAQRDSSQYEQISVQNIKMEVIKKQQQVKQIKPIKKQTQTLNNRNGVHLYNKTIENNEDQKINKDIDRNGDKDRNKTRNKDEQIQNDEEQENQDDQIQQLDRYCYYDVENIPDNDQQQQQQTQKKEQPQLKYNYKHDEDIENMYNLNIQQQQQEQQQEQQQHENVNNQQPIVQQPFNQQQIIQEYQEQDFLEEQQGQQQKYQQLILHYNSDPFIQQQQHKQVSVIKQQQLLQLIVNQKKDKSPQYENENKLQLNIPQVKINESQYDQNNNQIQHPNPQQQAHPDPEIQIYNQEHVNQRQIQKPQLNLCMIEEKLIDDQPNLQKQVQNISVKQSQVLQSLQNANEDEKQSADDKQIEQQAHQIEILPNMKQDQVKHNQIIEVQKQVQREFEQLQVSQQQQRKLQEYEQKQQKQEKQINQQQLKQYQNKQKEIEKENINQMQQQQQQILESIQVGQKPQIEPYKQKQIQVQKEIQVQNKEIQRQQYHHEHYQQQKSHEQQHQQNHQQQHQQQQKQQEQPQVYQYQEHQILEQQQQQEKVKKQLSIIREQQESQKKQNSQQMEVQQIEQIKVNQQKLLSNFIIQSQFIENKMQQQCKNNIEISKQRIIEEINNKQERMKCQNIIKEECKNEEIVIEKRPKASGVKIKFQHISILKQQSQQSQYEQEQQYQEEEKERDQQ